MVESTASSDASKTPSSNVVRSAPVSTHARSNTLLWATLLGILGLSFALRVGDLDAMVNVDMHLVWIRRIARFIHALGTGDFRETYQTHHPGVTFMWSAGLLWKAFGVLDTPLDPEKLKLAVWPVLVVGSLFPVVSFWFMMKVLGRGRQLEATIAAILFASEPMLVAHSRNAHLDVLVTSFAWVAVLAALVAKNKESYRWAVLSGVLLGLGLLSKMSGAGYAIGIAVVFVFAGTQGGRISTKLVKLLAVIAAVSAVVVFVLWPALWVAPQMVVIRLYRGLSSEVDKVGHFMFLGQTGRVSPPFWSYGVFIVYLLTPEFFIPGLAIAVSARWLEPRVKRFALDATLATLPLVFLVAKSNHVGTRYLIPALPIFGTLTALVLAQGYRYMRARLSERRAEVALGALLVVLTVGRSVRVLELYPLPITYCSQWTGIDCGKLFHTGWGEGMKEAALFVNAQAERRGYGDALTVYGGGCVSTITVWSRARFSKDLEQAHFMIQYLSDSQRHVPSARAIDDYVQTNHLVPLHEVRLNERIYAWIYAGPRY